MIIKKAEIKHLKEIIEIEKICFPPLEAANQKEFEERFKLFGNHFIIALNNDKVIGFINGSCTNSTILADELYHDAYLHDEKGEYQTVFGLDVLPDYQHQGVASQLMECFISIAKQENRKGIILTCKDHLVGFYERFGYQCLGTSASTHGGTKWNDMILIFDNKV